MHRKLTKILRKDYYMQLHANTPFSSQSNRMAANVKLTWGPGGTPWTLRVHIPIWRENDTFVTIVSLAFAWNVTNMMYICEGHGWSLCLCHPKAFFLKVARRNGRLFIEQVISSFYVALTQLFEKRLSSWHIHVGLEWSHTASYCVIHEVIPGGPDPQVRKSEREVKLFVVCLFVCSV